MNSATSKAIGPRTGSGRTAERNADGHWRATAAAIDLLENLNIEKKEKGKKAGSLSVLIFTNIPVILFIVGIFRECNQIQSSFLEVFYCFWLLGGQRRTERIANNFKVALCADGRRRVVGRECECAFHWPSNECANNER